MCGIVGLFLKTSRLQPSLGRLTGAMLEVMTDRGPDSAGFAVYDAVEPDRVKLTVCCGASSDPDALALSLAASLGYAVPVVRHGDHAVLSVPAADEVLARDAIRALAPDARIVSHGNAIELYKGVGLPAAVCDRFALSERTGTHAIGHTRMATESAVTVAGAHPFSTGADQCLVHNGSLSNHNAIRRMLVGEGLSFETDNDSEVAAGYLSWRLAQGARLEEALEAASSDLDGFYTFVVGTRTGFAVLRDPVACKPAVMAETDDYVAFGSEYRALAGLPDIGRAHVFEPEPHKVYLWERAA